ncbi:MAG: NAD(P)/FAD-dependent oxidoreductase [Candidatus Zixiibacteriota bacterium]
MVVKNMERRDFIKALLAGLAMTTLDWSALPKAVGAQSEGDGFDAVIIGSGLGGLSCAAAFARQGFKPLVLEKHYVPGGYATTFKRDKFVFDVSLHSTSVGERGGVHNLIPGFPEITDVEFVPHPNLYRAKYPEHDFRVPQRDLEGYIKMLVGYFPDEKEGIEGLFNDMKGVSRDINKLMQAKGQVDMRKFPIEFPDLFKCYTKTWGQMVDERVKNPKLKAIVSSQWGYYGLPPSKLAGYYYAMPAIDYLQNGGYYPIGKSQKISDALVKFIQDRGGKVILETKVDKILTKDHAAYGVLTADGQEFKGKVIISNANAYDTFHTMMEQDEYLKDYLARMDGFSVSLSSFQVFLGLKKNLVKDLGIEDTEIFYACAYDPEADYRGAVKGDVGGGYGLTLYDNLYDKYSPKGKNTINIITIQGYEFWEKYEPDYFEGKKSRYKAEKERMADILIDEVERTLLPGLRKAIDIKEIGTPLTNLRYTGNYRGAIYGWDQTLDNSGPNRLGHETPIKNLYLAGAWTQPGHGYGGVIWSGLECFGEIMQKW